MSLAAMVAGAPFLFADGEGDGVAPGDSLAPGVAVGLEEGAGDSTGVGVGDSEGLCFFFGEDLGEDSGVGVGEDFRFFFSEADALDSAFSAGVGLPEVFLFFDEGDGDFSGVADGFGPGDFSASSFFFGAVELLRCFRGVGVGVGAKIFVILLPNDSSARARSATPKSIAITKRVPAILLTRRMERESSTSAGDEYALRNALSSRAAQTTRDLTQKFDATAKESVQPLNRVTLLLATRKSISDCEVPRRLRGSG